MKKLILLLVILPLYSLAQQMSCCKVSSTEKFNQLASTESFASFHLSPEPFSYSPTEGSMITFKCADESIANGFEVKSDKPSNNWLFVFHEWWGLNDYIKRQTEEYSYQLSNVNILAIDLYDGQIAEDAGTAQQIMQSISDERARSIISAAIKYVGANAKIATVGWCFGGGWSLQSSLMEGKQAVACVMYYGMPETNLEKLKKLNSDVYGIFAKKDGWITPEVVATFQKNMKAANKKITVKSYDADHAFANPSNPKFNKQAMEEANDLIIAYLKSKLK